MVVAPDRPGTSITSEDDMAEASARWPNFARLVLARAEEELPRWGRSTLKFRDAANPNAEPFFTLDDKDEVQHWEYIEGLHKHNVQSLRMVADTLVRRMSEAFEVSHVYLFFLAYIPLFSLVLILSLTVVRNSRSNLIASHSSFVMKAAYGRCLLVNGLLFSSATHRSTWSKVWLGAELEEV
jgi:hypothetical protein